MNALVVSHACATAANRAVFEEMAARVGWNITLVVPENWRDEFGNRLHERSTGRLNVLHVPVILNGNIILHAYRFHWKKFLLEGDFDAVFVQHEPYAAATWQVCRAAKSLPAPPAFGFSSCQNIKKHYPLPFSAAERMVLHSSRFAFPITGAVAGVLEQKGFDGGMRVCPLPVDLSLCRPRARESAGMQEPVIGFVGRFVPEKGVLTLLDALDRLKDRAWRAVFVGAGPLRDVMCERLRQGGLEGRATFTGYVPHAETPRLLASFDMLILPSETRPNWKEQFGRVIPEALACGTCVIGSDSGEIPKLIHASGGGIVFPEGRADRLAEEIGGLRGRMPLRNPGGAFSRPMGEGGRSGRSGRTGGCFEVACGPSRIAECVSDHHPIGGLCGACRGGLWGGPAENCGHSPGSGPPAFSTVTKT
jgi:L-malate glycosyltransferase